MAETSPSSILVIGKGPREHALGTALRSPETQLYFAPGNAGTAAIGENIPYESVGQITRWAREHDIGLTVVGPENPLAEGIVDAFANEQLPIFGPTQKAATLETSKSEALAFMQRYHIPHPVSRSFTTVADALDYIEDFPEEGIVVKVDGLASGKGVVVANTPEQARAAVREILEEKKFGPSGETLVMQERLFGPEISVLAFSDGTRCEVMPIARDHKRLRDNDKGPNTGGMGAIAPVENVDPKLMEQIQDTILQPTIDGMRHEGTPFVGVLFAGIMLTNDGPKVLEFNVRFGDPETQVILALLASSLPHILLACIRGELDTLKVTWSNKFAAGIVLAREEYPAPSPLEVPIKGLDAVADATVFHGATVKRDGEIFAGDGRVVTLVATGNTLDEALQKAYGNIGDDGVHFAGMQLRRDIGKPNPT